MIKMTTVRNQMNELGFYTLPGAPKSPRDLIHEVESAEELGLGACFISERFNIKEAVTLSGAVGAVAGVAGVSGGFVGLADVFEVASSGDEVGPEVVGGDGVGEGGVFGVVVEDLGFEVDA
jgi:hypothetical protein